MATPATSAPAVPERQYGLTETQISKLLEGINPKRIKRDQGGHPMLPGWDVRAHLIRIFGPVGFDIQVTRSETVFLGPAERGNGYDAIVGCDVRLTIKDQWGNILAAFEDGNVGEAQSQRTQGAAFKLAYKSARTGAIKRAATYLGDQFGLSLSAKNAPDEPKRDPAAPVVVRTLAWAHDDEKAGDLEAGGAGGGLGDDDDAVGFQDGDADQPPAAADQPPARPQAVPDPPAKPAATGGNGDVDWDALAVSGDVDWGWLADKAGMSKSKMLTRLRRNGFDDLTNLDELQDDNLRRALGVVRQSVPAA